MPQREVFVPRGHTVLSTINSERSSLCPYMFSRVFWTQLALQYHRNTTQTKLNKMDVMYYAMTCVYIDQNTSHLLVLYSLSLPKEEIKVAFHKLRHLSFFFSFFFLSFFLSFFLFIYLFFLHFFNDSLKLVYANLIATQRQSIRAKFLSKS